MIFSLSTNLLSYDFDEDSFEEVAALIVPGSSYGILSLVEPILGTNFAGIFIADSVNLLDRNVFYFNLTQEEVVDLAVSFFVKLNL